MASKKQVVIIHGGDFFDTQDDFLEHLRTTRLAKEDLLGIDKKGWKDALQGDLGDGFEVLRPAMPSKYNAKYVEWKTWFERVAEFVEDGVVFIGHSLGGIFLARYLSENDFAKRISGVFFVAAPYFGVSKGKEGENAGFVISGPLRKLEEAAGKLVFYYSEDDEIVSASHAKKYERELPKAEYRIFTDRGHFFAQEHFPELVSAIRSLP